MSVRTPANAVEAAEVAGIRVEKALFDQVDDAQCAVERACCQISTRVVGIRRDADISDGFLRHTPGYDWVRFCRHFLVAAAIGLGWL